MDAARNIKAATLAGGRSYHPNTRETALLHNRKTKEELLASLLRAGELDPDYTSAAQALHNLQLSVDSDFDDGVRLIKRGIRDARVADDIVGRFQTESLTNYDNESRRTDPVFNHLPLDIVDLLGSGWYMLPLNCNSSLRH